MMPHQSDIVSIREEQHQKVHQYEFGHMLGEGDFGQVWAATHLPSKTEVAIKCIFMLELKTDEERKDSINEVILLQKTNSRFVIKCYEAFLSEEQILHMVLEYMDGGDLLHRINAMRDRGKLFSERVIWCFFHQICSGIRDLHSIRILHRDLKPANVFLTTEGRVKIGDLGLSRQFSAKTKAALTRKGTEYYMSPERNSEGGYHFKSDIWSLGCLLYEMCTYRSPFYGETFNRFALHKRIRIGDHIPFPTDLYSEQLEYFYSACLSLDPDDRPSIEECWSASRDMWHHFEEMLAKNKAAQ